MACRAHDAALCRWLGSALSSQVLRKRGAEALEACPKQDRRQRAFLHVLQGDSAEAAKLLAAAPGLGWSNREHPGHLLFPLFQTLLGGDGPSSPGIEGLERELEIDELVLRLPEDDQPRLARPEIGEILRRAGIEGMPNSRDRKAVIAAMRKAAEKRVAGVTVQKRRRHYEHAAMLVAACVACDRSPETARWVALVREGHRRYPALRAELDRCLGLA